MRIALRELRRRPGRFAVATVILTLLAVLLMFLGALLDGLLASQTGAYRAQQGDLVVYGAEARDSLVRSRVDAGTRDQVEAAEGVAAVGGLGSVQLGARIEDPDTRDLVSTVLFGYEAPVAGLPDEPPGAGEVVADDALRADGVEEGTTLLLGPARSPVTVVGFVEDSRYAGQASLWGSLDTWREVGAANRPDLAAGDEVVQALLVTVDDGSDPAAVAAAVDDATGGATRTLTVDEAVEALPGVAQQRSTFNQIIGVTVVVALVVVALFFALITMERTALYGVLKAIGASGSTLVAGVVAQTVAVTLVASAVGLAATLALGAAIPPGAVPFAASPSRLGTSVVLLLVAAVAGSAFSLRRVLRIDPASAIG
jgi:putative ABC transport system permease protein